MNKLNSLPERALELVGSVGDGIRQAVPNSAIKWVETGAALTALRTGTRVATKFVKRNPAVAVAAVAGAGLLWYVARRKAKQAERNGSGAIEGTSTRVEAKRASRPSTARKRSSRSAATE
ncbi:hypothetical protein M2650_15700 [Luteimonas sp. SX5]|uniref:DUF3618 domain-containing protein n=1 Tax=Luteimonas galliterrae TaxID=2940486 RepID=A0ABT0MN09_9GAMM|nr:hypothetical protein [Luteimonas galliterrae]MCL1636068.1 hypothetical protein [Luteimonas galliterrae]